MSKEFEGWVYKITNDVNKKVYIGITTLNPEKRKSQHFSIKRSGCPRLSRALTKYGIEKFNWEIIDKAPSLKELSEKEIYYISLFKSNNSKYGYNILSGGFTNEGAIKARRRPIYDVETGEVFQSIVDASIYYKLPKEEISLQLRGRQKKVHGFSFKYVDNNMQKQVESKVRFKKIKSRFRKPILCIELNQEFCSIIDVVKHIGYCRNTVWKALNGYKTIIPYTFIRLTDDLGVKNG